MNLELAEVAEVSVVMKRAVVCAKGLCAFDERAP
jgi:hypothetical protein